MATLDSSNITDGNTVEPNDLLQLYDAFTPGGGTTGEYNVTISGSLTGNASTATSASYAVTASYALNGGGGGTVTQINSQEYSNIGTGPTEAPFKFYAGKVRIISNKAETAQFSGLVGKTLGTNVWVTATVQGVASSYSMTVPIILVSSLSNGAILFESIGIADGTDVHYHVIYIAG